MPADMVDMWSITGRPTHTDQISPHTTPLRNLHGNLDSAGKVKRLTGPAFPD